MARTVPRPRGAAVRSVSKQPAWASLKDEQLLDLRLCDLDLSLEGSWLERPIAGLHEELERRKLRLKPHIWLSAEWFSPDGITGFAIPFYLAHPRLMRLERKQMLEVEGGNLSWCMKLLRHEAGHVLQTAYQLHRRRRWQRVFGKASLPYPDSYTPVPASKDFVLNLQFWYAQSHPTEDFAETFAVWLKPGQRWRARYAQWPALDKLRYVDSLMEELQGVAPVVRRRQRVEPLRSLKITLREHYRSRQVRYGHGFPDIYDRDLRRLFSHDLGDRGAPAASAFLRSNRTEIRRLVARWTEENQFTLDLVFDEMQGRCRELNLRAAGDAEKLRLDFAILLTARTMQHLYTERDRVLL